MRVPQSARLNNARLYMLADRAGTMSRANGPAVVRHRYFFFILIVVLVCATTLLQLSTYPNHDVAWVLWGSREMLRGAQWGIDIIEPNPPLIWYLSMPSTAMAMWLNLPLDWTYRIVVALGAGFSAAYFSRLSSDDEDQHRRNILGIAAAATLLLMPAREFGQREHLMAIAVLPYLALAYRRIEGHAVSKRSAIGIGIMAGLGLALKPYFLVVPVLIEAAVQVLGRRRPPLFRAENFAMGGVIAIYVAFLVISEQAYLRDVVPLANEIYWSFNLPIAAILPSLLTRFAIALPFAVYAIYRRDAFGVILSVAIFGAAASYLVQHKGYAYHLLPVSIFSIILVAHFLTISSILARVAIVAMLALTFECGRPVYAWWQTYKPGGSQAVEVDQIRRSIADHAANQRYLIVAVHPYPTFPVAIYTAARHVSRTNSHWFLPAVLQLRAGSHQEADQNSIERHAREFMLRDLSAQPDLVLIDRNSARHTMSGHGLDFLSFYEEDPAFRRAWEPYREIKPIGEYRQFIRVPRKGHPGS